MEDYSSNLVEHPSPLMTEADTDYDQDGGPSSVEAQADPNDLSFDLDLDIPTYPLASANTASNDIFSTENNDDIEDNNPVFSDLFTTSSNLALEPDVKVEGAVAGLCGFYNFANTCYMNSGLQCLLATPTIVKYFSESLESYGIKSDITGSSSVGSDSCFSITARFQPLLRNVWAGEYSLLKPVDFKDCLSTAHPQFSGSHQHDCQEFLALLLDTMHEELRGMSSDDSKKSNHESECGTSMELHTAHSNALSWLSRNSSLELEAKNNEQRKSKLEDNESRCSASPKSYDSGSSVMEDKVASAIRQQPIPKTLKAKMEDEIESDEEMSFVDEMESSSNSPHFDSNLVNPEKLIKCNNVKLTASEAVNNSRTTEDTEKDQNFYTKENKTLNVNVLAENLDQEMNNEISFDSEKYARLEAKTRPRGTIDNLTEADDDGDNKAVNKSRLLCNFSGIKRMRLDSSEKNYQLEMERSIGGASALTPTSPTLDPARLKEAIEADRFWEKYLAANDTVVARTFQGQFKSSVVCRTCHYVSVSFEPFMYLPVPLPGANIRQIEVTYIGENEPVSLLLDMSQADNVGHLKAKVVAELNLEAADGLQVAEVLGHHISRVVDEWTLLKCLKDDRRIYVIKTAELRPAEDVTVSEAIEVDSDAVVPQSVIREYASCVICMEDLPATELRQHNACDCVICAPCLERTIEHHGSDPALAENYVKCPGCRQEAEASTEFVALDQIGKCKPKLRIFNLPVLCRLDHSAASDNNKKAVVTFGHPALVQVPNRVNGKQLFQLLRPFIPKCGSERPELALVNAQGKLCSRCIFNSHCSGCIRIQEDNEDEIILQVNDTIAITYTNLDGSDLGIAGNTIRHSSMERTRLRDKLSLDDCLEAFSRTEELDETNPWFCPICRKNKCATKTLSIWRFPDYLIVYLKRFVFTNSGALKLEKDVEFKVNDLDLTPYLSGPLQSDTRPVFNMYGCVCHFGSVYGGHYTAFARHLGSNQWNYFDDGAIAERKVPGDSPGDFSSGYILFYQRSGSKQDNLIPMLSRKCRAFALENNSSNEEKLLSSLNNQRTDEDGLEDEDEAEATNPDLSQIIRSLDTPPPS